MPPDIDLRLLVPAPVRRIPADLGVVVCFVLVTGLSVLLPVVRDWPIRLLLAMPFVLFVPGYVVIAALFPERKSTDREKSVGPERSAKSERPAESEGTAEVGSTVERVRSRFDGGIGLLDRFALSFGASIAVVPLIGLVLDFTPWGIRLVPVVVAVGGFTLLTTALAVVRRWNVPDAERFSVPFRRWGAAIRTSFLHPETRVDAALNVVVVLCVLLAVASVGYAVTVPNDGENVTEFYLLSRADNGTFTAGGYPTDLTTGERKSVYVGVKNHGHQRNRYTVVVLVQRLDTTGNGNGASVRNQRELTRVHAVVGPNETWRTKTTLDPEMTGDHLRVQYLLYEGPVPNEPSQRTAAQELHLWVNVSNGGNS